jgi:hypothetical protein
MCPKIYVERSGAVERSFKNRRSGADLERSAPLKSRSPAPRILNPAWKQASSGFSETMAIRNENDKQEASTSGIPCKKKKEMTGKVLNEVDSL